MPHARTRWGIRIFYEVHEPDAPTSADPLVLVHGVGLSGRFWFDIPRSIACDAATRRRVITIDNRGTGRSDKPWGPYRMRDMADDVAAVLDACEIRRAVVAGFSLGGMVALNFAVRHPERLSGLVLLATTPGFPVGRVPGLGALARLFALPIAAGRRIRWLDRLLLSDQELDRAPEIFARWPATLRQDPMYLRTFAAQLAAAAGHTAGLRLSRIRCPTVVLAGADDILRSSTNAERIARRIPNSYVEVLPGVAHGIPWSNPRIIHHALEKLANVPLREPVADR